MRSKEEQERILKRALEPPSLITPDRPFEQLDDVTGSLPDEGRIVAVLIDSTVLDAEIWFALRDGWKPDEGDNTPVFYASELPMLRQKTPEQLRSIFRVKATFGPRSRPAMKTKYGQ